MTKSQFAECFHDKHINNSLTFIMLCYPSSPFSPRTIVSIDNDMMLLIALSVLYVSYKAYADCSVNPITPGNTNPAPIGDQKWIAKIRLNDFPDQGQTRLCIGVFLQNDFVLTAASFLYDVT